MRSKPGDDARIKALHAIDAGNGTQQRERLFAERVVAWPALELDNHGRFRPQCRHHLGEERHALAGFKQSQGKELLCGQRVHARVNAANALEVVIMKHDDIPVLGKLHIEFDAVAPLPCGGKRGQGIFGNGLILGIQSPMGVQAAGERRALRVAGSARRSKKHP
ncbi:hypothetical protein SDC9_96401 [bioreactor metagenome]|uniref:Uncharacterized protein n=1 Tax=bioreactor metagenome TaxID=1076179 RepID=A0A645ABM2_9ZZZZ